MKSFFKADGNATDDDPLEKRKDEQVTVLTRILQDYFAGMQSRLERHLAGNEAYDHA